MEKYSPVCAAPSRKYPQGRTGTPAGHHLHRRAAEPPCNACRDQERTAQKNRYVRNREKGLPEGVLACEQSTRYHPAGMRGTESGHAKHKRFGQESCPECREAHRDAAAKRYAGNPQKFNKQHRLWRHNVTPERYEELQKAQDRKCAICGAMESRGRSFEFHIDHDHSCCPGKRSCGKCVRGLLCSPCNTGIGLLNDSPDQLMAAAAYLLQQRDVLMEVNTGGVDRSRSRPSTEAAPARDGASTGRC